MGIQIEGISGYKAEVTSRNLVRSLASTLSYPADVALYQQRLWTIADTKTPTGAGDYFFYMLNDGLRDLMITYVALRAASAETISLVSVTGTAAAGTAFTPANRTIGSSRQPSTDVTIQTGVDITGLTQAKAFIIAAVSTGIVELDLTLQPLILQPGNAIAMVATTGAIALQLNVNFCEQVIDPEVVI
jgi:hypothetical protein